MNRAKQISKVLSSSLVVAVLPSGASRWTMNDWIVGDHTTANSIRQKPLYKIKRQLESWFSEELRIEQWHRENRECCKIFRAFWRGLLTNSSIPGNETETSSRSHPKKNSSEPLHLKRRQRTSSRTGPEYAKVLSRPWTSTRDYGATSHAHLRFPPLTRSRIVVAVVRCRTLRESNGRPSMPLKSPARHRSYTSAANMLQRLAECSSAAKRKKGIENMSKIIKCQGYARDEIGADWWALKGTLVTNPFVVGDEMLCTSELVLQMIEKFDGRFGDDEVKWIGCILFSIECLYVYDDAQKKNTLWSTSGKLFLGFFGKYCTLNWQQESNSLNNQKSELGLLKSFSRIRNRSC